MDIGFIAPVNKSSGTPFNPSVAAGTFAPGFREQISGAMRNYGDTERERTIEKKSAGQKKPAAAETSRNSAKDGGKTDALKQNDLSTDKYADTEKSAAARITDNEESSAAPVTDNEETSETSKTELVSAVDDSGFHGELKDAEISETEDACTSAYLGGESSETENVYSFAPLLEETSETETAYMSESAVEETPATEDIADSYEFSSAETLLFPSLLDGNDSGFTALMSMEATAENAAADAGLNAAQNAGANSTPVAATEVISQMIVSQTPAAPSPETADVNVQQAAASSSGEAANGGKELLAALTGEQKSVDAEPVPPELNELLEKGVFQKNQVSAQNAGRNAAAPSRGDQVRYEIKPEAKATVNAEPELSKQPAIRTSSENDALIMERVAAQTARQRNGAALANASENAGKTVQVMETSFQLTSATTKAEASVPTRNVPMSDQEFVIELAGRIQAQIRGGREMIRIQLHPEELGRLEIRAESGRNGIIARIAAESLDVKKLLEGNLQGLQQTLEARGLKIDRLHIVVEDSADAALLADGGRYGHAGTGPRNSEVSDDYSRSAGARTKSQNANELNDLSMALEAEQRGVGFYTVG